MVITDIQSYYWFNINMYVHMQNKLSHGPSLHRMTASLGESENRAKDGT